MDLLRTLLVYMSLVFTTSVQTAPVPSYIPTPEPTPVAATATPVPTPKPTPVPTIDMTPNPAYKTVQVGDNGELVRQMQEKLAEYGYYEGDIDGRFGNQTRRAVEQFQYQHGLSADGIAGRRTLTVLYESEEIRPAPDAEATASPTPEAVLTVAITPTPSPTPAPSAAPSPAFVPVETVKPTAAPLIPMEPIAECVILIGEQELEAAPCMVGDVLYLPVQDMLRAAGLNIISSSSIEKDEFAFAIGGELISVSYTENQAGEPVNVEVYKNLIPQLMPVREIRRAGETLYMPAASIESLTGFAAQLSEDGKSVRVLIPETVEME